MGPDFFPDDLAEWTISKTYGLLFEDPLEHLPDYFSAWNKLAKTMPSLVKDGQMRKAVQEMALLDARRLANKRELRLAHLQLSFIAAGYVWQDGDSGVVKSLPQQVAVPLCRVADKLGCLPVLNHGSLALANWRKIDTQGDNTIANLMPMYLLPGGDQCRWFIAAALEAEVILAPAWQAIPEVINAVRRDDEGTVCDKLAIVADCMSRATDSLAHLHDKVSPKFFFEEVRPFLFGWGWKHSPLPNGLIYEGVSETPIKAPVGGTSMLLKPVDLLCDIQFTKASAGFYETESRTFHDGFRKYLAAIKKYSTLRQFVQERHSERLSEAYNTTVAAVTAFRTYHLGIATKYAVQEAAKEDTSRKFESTSTVSSAGHSIHPTLNAVCEETKQMFL